MQLPRPALPLRLGPGHVSSPQGPCPQDECQQGIPCNLLMFEQRPWAPGAPLRRSGARAAGELDSGCQVLSGGRAVLDAFGLNLGSNSCGGWYYHYYYYYYHFPEEEVPNSLVQSCHLWPCSAVCLQGSLLLLSRYSGPHVARACLVLLKVSGALSPPSSQGVSSTFTAKMYVYPASTPSSFLLFCGLGPRGLWLSALSRPGPLLGSLACSLPGRLQPGLTWCQHRPNHWKRSKKQSGDSNSASNHA